MSPVNVAVAGITGWVGREIARAVRDSPDLRLRAGVARTAAGRDAGDLLADESWSVPIVGTVAEALSDIDVLVDYTSHEAVHNNVLAAIEGGVNVVVGSSGLTEVDFEHIDALARRNEVAVVAAGNFSLTAAVAKAAALLAVRHLRQWEIIDYAMASKRDAPSGTARELAEAMTAAVGARDDGEPGPLDPQAARGDAIGLTRVHSLRLPSFSVSTEVVFGLPEERLSIRHDAGETARPYIAGTMLAIRATRHRVGVVRGLDQLLDAGD